MFITCPFNMAFLNHEAQMHPKLVRKKNSQVQNSHYKSNINSLGKEGFDFIRSLPPSPDEEKPSLYPLYQLNFQKTRMLP